MISAISKTGWRHHLPCFAHSLSLVVQDSIKTGWRHHLPCFAHSLSLVQDSIKTGWRHLPCFAHSLNLVVQDSIEKDTAICTSQQQCKDIVSHFHRSVKSAETLWNVQKQLKVPEHKLVQEVSTRWNSTYLMFERIVEQSEAITTALCLLGQNHLCLKNEDKEYIPGCLKVLKPFLEAAKYISGDKYVSFSFDQQAIESASHRTTSTEAVIEVHRYFEEPVISRSSDPLAWWKKNNGRLPCLMHVAKKYLCISGSSVPAERLFSKAGQLVSERRKLWQFSFPYEADTKKQIDINNNDNND